jgi:3D (Asp-Asp-Asp) domain-containing protein
MKLTSRNIVPLAMLVTAIMTVWVIGIGVLIFRPMIEELEEIEEPAWATPTPTPVPRPDAGLYRVTYYSHGCALPTDGVERAPRPTASGVWPRANRTVAADWRLHPPGTRLRIRGLGRFIVEDRGSWIKGQRIDVFVSSCAEAIRRGRQWRRVHAI